MIGNATKLIGNATKSIGNVTKSIGNATKSIGNVTKSIGNVTKSIGNATKSIGNVTKSIGNVTKSIAVRPISSSLSCQASKCTARANFALFGFSMTCEFQGGKANLFHQQFIEGFCELRKSDARSSFSRQRLGSMVSAVAKWLPASEKPSTTETYAFRRARKSFAHLRGRG